MRQALRSIRQRTLASTVLALTVGLTSIVGLSTSPAAATDRAPGFPTPKLERVADQLLDTGAVGLTAEVRKGKKTWALDVGRSTQTPPRPVAPGSRFRAGSVSKQLVAVLALQQVESGAWTLDTTIGEAAPGLWPGREAVTLRQLLSHTSGMPDYLAPLVSDATSKKKFLAAISKRWTDDEIITFAQQLPWTQEPGTAFSYSNTNFVVVGEMLRRATGQSVGALVKREVLKPAGMKDSFFASDPALPKPALLEYARLPGRLTDLRTFQPSMFSSAGSLVSTAHDLNLFRRALARGDLIPKSLVRTMQTPVDAASGYGLGSFRLPNPCSKGPRFVYGHDGATWGTLTFSIGAGTTRAVSVATTGRSYIPKDFTKQVKLLAGFALGALEEMCGGSPSRRASTHSAVLGLDARIVPGS